MTRLFRRETQVAVDTVTQALDLARRRVGADEIASKGGRDLVTATDVAVEDAVRDMLSGAVGFPVIGEEGGGEPSADGSPYWLVDAICGPSAPRCRCPMWRWAAPPPTCCSRSRRCTPARAASSSPRRGESCPISTAGPGPSNQTPSSRALILLFTASCSSSGA